MINNNRTRDKWIIPANNKGLNRHKLYVGFVVSWKIDHGRFPTINEYLKNIVSFLNKTGANKRGMKTSEQHQLFQPIFFNMLTINNGLVEPTKLGIYFMQDTYSKYESILVLNMFYKATFSSGVTGSRPDYDKIYPIKELVDNLVKYGSISFEDLNTKFYSKKPNIDLAATKPVDGKDPKWRYVLSMMEEAGLIESDGKVLQVSRGISQYNPKSHVYPTNKLKDLMNHLDEVNLLNKSLRFEDVSKVVDTISKFYKGSLKAQQRDAMKQSIYRNQLLYMHGSVCQMCGISSNALLVASHIKPYSKSGEDEKFDPNNGLLLCSLHDAIFDKGLITFIDGKLVFSSKIDNDNKIINKTISKKPNIHSDMVNYMKYHNKKVFKE